MKTRKFCSMRNVAFALSHQIKFGKTTDYYRLSRKLKKAMKKYFI